MATCCKTFNSVYNNLSEQYALYLANDPDSSLSSSKFQFLFFSFYLTYLDVLNNTLMRVMSSLGIT